MNIGFIKDLKLDLRLFLFIGLIIGCTLPKLMGLTTQSLWLDEINILRYLSLDNLADFFKLIRNEPHPPGYLFLMWIYVRLVDLSVYNLRLSSALLSISAILAHFLLTLRWAGLKIAVTSTALFGLSCTVLYEAQNVRPYSLVFLLAAVSTAIFATIIKNQQASGKDIGFYLLINTLLSLTHYSAVLFIGAQALVLALWGIKSDKAASRLVNLLILSLPVVPAALFLLWSMQIYNVALTDTHWQLKDLLSPVRAFFGQASTLLLIFIPLLFCKSVSKQRLLNFFNDRLLIALFAVILLMVFFIIAAAVYHSSWMQNKNFYVIFPAGYLLFALLISKQRLFKTDFGPLFTIAVCTVSLIIYLTTGYPLTKNSFYSPFRDQVRESAELINKIAGEQDILLLAEVDMNGNHFYLVPTLAYQNQIEPNSQKWHAQDIRILASAENPDARMKSLQDAMTNHQPTASLIIDLPHNLGLLGPEKAYLQSASACVKEWEFYWHRVIQVFFDQNRCEKWQTVYSVDKK
jgi:uncharacterized membrane protein